MTKDDFKTCCKDPEGFAVNDEFLRKLNLVEDELGEKFDVRSGFRCKKCNAQTPGADPNSLHMQGLAVDVACLNPAKRGKLYKACFKHGIVSLVHSKQRRFVHISGSPTPWVSSYDY